MMSKIFRFVMATMLVGLLAACGGGGGTTVTSGVDPGAGSGDVTIAGKVAGTTFVAVETSGGSVAARNVAAAQNNGSKTFSIKVQSGKQYKFYLVENEGTTDERVFPLYIGNSNKFGMSAGTCDLGFVSTASGNAVPEKTPAQFAGAGEDASVPAGVATNQSSVFTKSDLAGTWYMFQYIAGANPYWARVTLNISADGTAIPSNGINSNGNTGQTSNMSLSISPSGVVGNTTSGSLTRLVMSKDRTLLVGTGGSNGEESMYIAVKAGSGFQQSDLAGSWRVHGLTASSTKKGWGRCDDSFDANGLLTQSNCLVSTGSTPSYIGRSFTISGTGLITGTVGTVSISGAGAMTQDKNLMVSVNTNGDGTVVLALSVRTGDTNFSQSDMKGTWRSNHLSIGSSDSYWVRSLAVVDTSGILSSFGVVANGVSEPDNTSAVPILFSLNGRLTGDSAQSQMEGIMAPNKKIAVYTKTAGSSNAYYRLGIIMK